MSGVFKPEFLKKAFDMMEDVIALQGICLKLLYINEEMHGTLPLLLKIIVTLE